MASAVIRVKRRITEEPFDKFVLDCKRFKTANDDNNENVGSESSQNAETDNKRTILHLAATINEDEDINSHITRLRKVDAEELARKVRKPLDITNKLRQQLKDDAQNQRFKVVNYFRSIENDEAGTAASSDAKNITVVDVIKEESKEPCGENHMPSEPVLSNSGKFVYDLYLVPESERLTEVDIKQYISIRPFDDLVYQANDETLDDSDIDSEDSNDEANFRNEYPSTDDNFSIGEDDMRRAVEELNVGSDGDLSSDDEDVYGKEPAIHFIENGEMDEFEYFKKHGRIQSHNAYYRKNKARNLARCDEDDDEYDDVESTSPASSQASPLVSCDDMSDDE